MGPKIAAEASVDLARVPELESTFRRITETAEWLRLDCRARAIVLSDPPSGGREHFDRELLLLVLDNQAALLYRGICFARDAAARAATVRPGQEPH